VTGRAKALPGPPRPNGQNVSNGQQWFWILLKAITNVSNGQQWFSVLIKRGTCGFWQNVSNVSNVSNGKKSRWLKTRGSLPVTSAAKFPIYKNSLFKQISKKHD
jgi:hypothetical protein